MICQQMVSYNQAQTKKITRTIPILGFWNQMLYQEYFTKNISTNS
ncbi:hypothetical protein ACEW7V_00855 [Areca yellow leaf disease phytoplasma]